MYNAKMSLVPQTLSSNTPKPNIPDGVEVNIVDPDESPATTVDPITGISRTETDDGSVIIDFSPKKQTGSTGHSENLAVELDSMNLSSLCSDLLDGIQADVMSRAELDQIFSRGIDLLGVKLEDASSEVTAQGSVSKVWHPILMEAVVRYQANASAELLPAAGPVKVRDDEPLSDSPRMALADAFEKDFNHYLTSVRKEYYPDTRRMFTAQGFYGTAFKKVYNCPLRRAPVSDYVSAINLIVSNDAVSLANAGRITHQSLMRPAVMKRMQILGAYADTTLQQPNSQLSEVQQKIKSMEGINPQWRYQDTPYTIYECYTDLDPTEYGLDEPDAPEGLPLPYRVTIDKDGSTILEIRRNWKEGDEDYKAIIRFVKYGFIPSLGFYDWGLVHLLGNTARALTAIERQLLDAGQFANFPGFLMSDRGSRQETTQIRVPPGGGHAIKTGGQRIQDIVMPIPYKEPSTVLAALADKIAEDGKRLGMTAEVNVGEGRADVPVGTTVALIEQATKVMGAVHKQNHSSQQEEFEMLRDLFMENPEALWKFAKKPARKWQMSEEFSDMELVPASDPNTPSRIHRVMQAQALAQLTTLFPSMNKSAALDIILQTLGYSANSNLNPPQTAMPSATPPVDPSKMAMVQLKQQDMQRKAQTEILQTQQKAQDTKIKAQIETIGLQTKQQIAAMQEETERMRLSHEVSQDNADHQLDKRQAMHDASIDHATLAQNADNQVANEPS